MILTISEKAYFFKFLNGLFAYELWFKQDGVGIQRPQSSIVRQDNNQPIYIKN